MALIHNKGGHSCFKGKKKEIMGKNYQCPINVITVLEYLFINVCEQIDNLTIKYKID